jgi:predicted RNA-binding Zn ribbon-like protein
VVNDASSSEVAHLVRRGGVLCLDFVNTVESRPGPVSREWLHGYADLVEWAHDAEAEALLRTAGARPSAARAAFRTAIDLREALSRVFTAIVGGVAPAGEDLEVLRRAYSDATQHGRLVPHDGGFAWTWDGDASLDRPWWPVAASAVELLSHGPLDRMKQCPTDLGCSWFFIDATKNRSRRWCSMDDCGSQIKARRQTDRRRAGRR